MPFQIKKQRESKNPRTKYLILVNKLESNNFCVPGSIDAEELTEIITTLYDVIGMIMIMIILMIVMICC